MYEILVRFAEQISNITVGIVFFFLLALALERLWPADKRTPLYHNETKFEIATAYISLMVLWPIGMFVVNFALLETLTHNIAHDFTSATIASWPFAVKLFVCLLAMDLAVYTHHRFAHRFLWPFHAIHHEAENVNWSTAWRLHPLDFMLILFDVIFLLFLGFPTDIILYASTIVSVSSNLTHFNLDFKWKGPMKYLLISPHFHRWHHALDKKATDSNYCFVFPFLDSIFGTYYCPDEKPEAYGIFHKDVPKQYFFGKWTYPFRWQLENIKKFFSK